MVKHAKDLKHIFFFYFSTITLVRSLSVYDDVRRYISIFNPMFAIGSIEFQLFDYQAFRSCAKTSNSRFNEVKIYFTSCHD